MAAPTVESQLPIAADTVKAVRSTRSGGAADDAATREQMKRLDAYYRRHHRYFLGQALKVVDSPEAAHEIVQEAFTVTAERIQEGTQIEHLGAWLRAVVRNRGMHQWRQAPTVPLDELNEPAGASSAASVAEDREDCRMIYRAAGELSPAQRSAFLLAELRGASRGEIADRLGRSEPAVRQLLVRARKLVRETAAQSLGSVAAFVQRTTGFVEERLAPLIASVVVAGAFVAITVQVLTQRAVPPTRTPVAHAGPERAPAARGGADLSPSKRGHETSRAKGNQQPSPGSGSERRAAPEQTALPFEPSVATPSAGGDNRGDRGGTDTDANVQPGGNSNTGGNSNAGANSNAGGGCNSGQGCGGSDNTPPPGEQNGAPGGGDNPLQDPAPAGGDTVPGGNVPAADPSPPPPTGNGRGNGGGNGGNGN